jgi:hypothetical protein
MKQTLTALTILFAGNLGVFAQCDKKLTMTSSKTEYLNKEFVVLHTVDEKTVIEISQTEISVVAAGENKMTGTIKSADCQWEKPFTKGKIQLKTVVNSPQTESKSVTITIEGKDGKLTFLAEPDDRPDLKIRVTLETFEEQKK